MKMRFSLGAAAAMTAVLMAGAASAATVTVTSAATFAADTTGSVAGDFTSVPLPNCTGAACFGGANPLSGYASLQGVSFSTSNLGGQVNVNSALFYSAADLSAPYLVNSQYTGPAADIITITLPTATTAFALDFSTLFNSTTATFSLSNGFSTDVANTATTGNSGATQFLGFLSNQAFDTITFSVPSQDSIVISDFQTATALGSAVPEPATWALMMIGVAGMGLALRRRAAKTSLA